MRALFHSISLILHLKICHRHQTSEQLISGFGDVNASLQFIGLFICVYICIIYT